LVPRISVTGSGSSLTGKETHHVPTPTASDHIKRQSTNKGTDALNFETNKAVSLDRWVRRWPTPTANEDAAGRPGSKMQKMLGNHPDIRGDLTGGALNPTWVEWLMGFPLGWTDLGPSATRSSRRSSK
jgi:hypothetical protein